MSERDRRAVLLGVAALAAMAVYAVAVRPAVDAYRELVGRHDAARHQVSRRLDERRKLEFLTQRVRDWEAKAGELAAPKTYSEQMTAVGERIIAASQEAGIKLQGTTPGAAMPWPDEPQVLQAPVQIEAQAQWDNVFKFLAAIYRIPGVISVEQMDLGSEQKGGESLKLKMTISVLVAPASEKQWAS